MLTHSIETCILLPCEPPWTQKQGQHLPFSANERCQKGRSGDGNYLFSHIIGSVAQASTHTLPNQQRAWSNACQWKSSCWIKWVLDQVQYGQVKIIVWLCGPLARVRVKFFHHVLSVLLSWNVSISRLCFWKVCIFLLVRGTSWWKGVWRTFFPSL